jgi:hypothetical protein
LIGQRSFIACREEPFVEHDGELGLGLAPFPLRHFPFSRDLAQDETQQFHRGLVGWKMASCSYGAMTCSQFRRQLCAMVGYFLPHGPASNSPSA